MRPGRDTTKPMMHAASTAAVPTSRPNLGAIIAVAIVTRPAATNAAPKLRCVFRHNSGSASVCLVRMPATQFGFSRGKTFPIMTRAAPNTAGMARMATSFAPSAAASSPACTPRTSVTTPSTMISYVLPKRANWFGLVTVSGALRNMVLANRPPARVGKNRNRSHKASASAGAVYNSSHRGAASADAPAAKGTSRSKSMTTIAGSRGADAIEATMAATMRSGDIHLSVALSIRASRLDPGEKMFHGILEHGRVQLVADGRAIALRGHELGVPEHGEVARHGGPRGCEVLGDFAG